MQNLARRLLEHWDALLAGLHSLLQWACSLSCTGTHSLYAHMHGRAGERPAGRGCPARTEAGDRLTCSAGGAAADRCLSAVRLQRHHGERRRGSSGVAARHRPRPGSFAAPQAPRSRRCSAGRTRGGARLGGRGGRGRRKQALQRGQLGLRQHGRRRHALPDRARARRRLGPEERAQLGARRPRRRRRRQRGAARRRRRRRARLGRQRRRRRRALAGRRRRRRRRRRPLA